MANFLVRMKREVTVEQTCVVEVEASSKEEAEDEAMKLDGDSVLDDAWMNDFIVNDGATRLVSVCQEGV